MNFSANRSPVCLSSARTTSPYAPRFNSRICSARRRAVSASTRRTEAPARCRGYARMGASRRTVPFYTCRAHAKGRRQTLFRNVPWRDTTTTVSLCACVPVCVCVSAELVNFVFCSSLPRVGGILLFQSSDRALRHLLCICILCHPHCLRGTELRAGWASPAPGLGPGRSRAHALLAEVTGGRVQARRARHRRTGRRMKSNSTKGLPRSTTSRRDSGKICGATTFTTGTTRWMVAAM